MPVFFYIIFFLTLLTFWYSAGRSCKQCAAAKRKCAKTEEELRKGQEEDGTEDGRMGRKRRLEKGKEREWTEGAEDEWRRKVEERLEGLEKAMTDGFREVMGRLGEVMRELAEVKELMDLESVGSEESEEDGEGDEEAVEQMVDRGVGTENGEDVEMVE